MVIVTNLLINIMYFDTWIFKKNTFLKKIPLSGNPAICRKPYYAQKDMEIEQKFYHNVFFLLINA